MIRRLLCIFFAFCMVLGMGITVSAAAPTGSLLVYAKGGEVTLYRAGDVEGSGFRLTEAFGGGYVTFQDSLSENLASWLAERAEGGTTLKADKDGVVSFPDLEEGLYLVVQTEAASGYYPFNPFLVNIPWDGYEWDMDAKPKMELLPKQSPQTGDDILPAVAAMLLSGMGLAFCLGRRKKKAQ